MSDNGLSGPGGEGLNAPSGFEVPAPSQEVNASPDELANPYLASIPEADRPVVAKYLRGWQGQVTQRFQKIHDEYRPYKDLGPADDLRTAREIYDLINNDPVAVINALIESDEGIRQAIFSGRGSPQQSPPVENFVDNPYRDSGLPDEFYQQFTQQGQILQALAQAVMGQQDSQTAAEEDAELDQLLGDLSEKYGDYDETKVLVYMNQGMDPDEAVQRVQQEYQDFINNYRSPNVPPPMLGGQGSIPAGGVDPTKMSPADRRKYVTQMLTAANENS